MDHLLASLLTWRCLALATRTLPAGGRKAHRTIHFQHRQWETRGVLPYGVSIKKVSTLLGYEPPEVSRSVTG